MTFFAISKKSTDSHIIDSPVFDVRDKDNEQSAIAVFFSSTAAHEYIQAAGWERDEAVAQMDASKILSWFSQAKQDGVNFVVVDPIRSDQVAGVPMEVISLDFPHVACRKILARFANRLHAS